MATTTKIGREVKYPSGAIVPTVHLSGLRATTQATAASTSAIPLPSGARIVALRASGAVWISWGSAGVGAAAKDDNSQLFPPGESVIPVPIVSEVVATHFTVLADGDDCYFQVEAIPHAGS